MGGGLSRGGDRDSPRNGNGDGGRGGGGREHSKIGSYRRAEGDLASVDVAAVEGMLERRSRLRERRAWNEADRLRDELQVGSSPLPILPLRLCPFRLSLSALGPVPLPPQPDQASTLPQAEYGVVVSDSDLEWRVWEDRGARGDRGDRGDVYAEDEDEDEYAPFMGGKGRQGGGGGAEGVDGATRAESFGLARRLQTPFGAAGHDYSRAEEDGHPLAADDFEPINAL